MQLVLETQHTAREETENADGEIIDRSYMLGEPVQEAIETTIFEGMEWPELRGKLFRFCQKEYGRCTSFVYIDRGPDAHKIGWVFEQLRPFDDIPEQTYTHQVWVTLLKPVQCDRGKRHLEPFAFDAAA